MEPDGEEDSLRVRKRRLLSGAGEGGLPGALGQRPLFLAALPRTTSTCDTLSAARAVSAASAGEDVASPPTSPPTPSPGPPAGSPRVEGDDSTQQESSCGPGEAEPSCKRCRRGPVSRRLQGRGREGPAGPGPQPNGRRAPTPPFLQELRFRASLRRFGEILMKRDRFQVFACPVLGESLSGIRERPPPARTALGEADGEGRSGSDLGALSPRGEASRTPAGAERCSLHGALPGALRSAHESAAAPEVQLSADLADHEGTPRAEQ